MNLDEALRLLKKQLTGNSHVVCISPAELEEGRQPGLYVYVDEESAKEGIPREINGHHVHIKVMSFPVFESPDE